MRCTALGFGSIALATLLAGCGAPATGVEATTADVPNLAQTASGGSARYSLQFIVETNQGEITSPPFPANGVALNTTDPWRHLKVAGVPLSLNNFTHGDWWATPCSTYQDTQVNWDIAGTSPIRSFAGGWLGDLEIWRGRAGVNLAFAGSRTGGAGEIRNVVNNNNVVYEERGSGDGYFLIRFTNARMGFGSLSTPDGNGSLGTLSGYEAACANFSLKATRLP
jgi:hypothetical protein